MRRFTTILLAVVAGMFAPLALLAWDVREVLFDTDRWVETTAPVLEDEQARHALALVLADGVVTSLECRGGVAGRVAASRLGESARLRAARQLEGALASPRAASAWSTLNRRAHAGFVRAVRTGDAGVDDRLLESAELLDLAAMVVAGIALGASGDDAQEQPAGPETECDGRDVEVVDPGAMRAAAAIARGLHLAYWLPQALALGSLALFTLALLIARTPAAALAWWALGGVLGAAAAWWGLDAGIMVLVDGIRGAAPRELAARLLDRAFEPVRGHQVVLGACAGVVLGAALAIAFVGRRREH